MVTESGDLVRSKLITDYARNFEPAALRLWGEHFTTVLLFYGSAEFQKRKLTCYKLRAGVYLNMLN